MQNHKRSIALPTALTLLFLISVFHPQRVQAQQCVDPATGAPIPCPEPDGGGSKKKKPTAIPRPTETPTQTSTSTPTQTPTSVPAENIPLIAPPANALPSPGATLPGGFGVYVIILGGLLLALLGFAIRKRFFGSGPLATDKGYQKDAHGFNIADWSFETTDKSTIGEATDGAGSGDPKADADSYTELDPSQGKGPKMNEAEERERGGRGSGTNTDNDRDP